MLSDHLNVLHNFDAYFTQKRTQIHGKFLVHILLENRGKIGADIAQNSARCVKSGLDFINVSVKIIC